MERLYPKTITLLNYPDEILEMIAQELDSKSLASFALTCTRLFGIASRIVRRFKTSHATPDVIKFLTCKMLTIRSLDLSHCRATSTLLQCLIFKSRQIEELNVVNSNLSFKHLVNVLGALKHLTKLSFTLLEVPKTPEKLKRGTKLNLRDIYLETNPSMDLMTRTMDFLNECPDLEKLHVNLIGRSSTRRSTLNHPVLLKNEIRQSVKSLIVSSHATRLSHIITVLRCIFLTQSVDDIYLTNMLPCWIYDSGECNFEPSNERLSVDKNEVLRKAYNAMPTYDAEFFPWGLPHGLTYNAASSTANHRMYCGYPPNWSSELVELDISRIKTCSEYNYWSELIAYAPALESIALTTAMLMPVTPTPVDKPPRIGHKRARDKSDFFNSLSLIKLRKLHIIGASRNLTDCSVFDKSFSPVAKFSELKYLEELTLQNVDTSPLIFSKLFNPNVQIVRFNLTGIQSVAGLKSFIQKCTKLKYFKLEIPSLQLDSALLWDALAHGESLRQICLGTRSSDSVDLASINKFLPKILDRIDLLHVHAEKVNNRLKLQKFLSNSVASACKNNRMVDFLPVSTPSLSNLENTEIPQCFPGRMLCSTTHYIGKIKPQGWDLLREEADETSLKLSQSLYR